MAEDCIDHLNFTNGTCPDCGLPVDGYGNTEAQFGRCCYPDCGCDGARLCAAGDASEFAMFSNVEGMYRGKTKRQREGVGRLLSYLAEEKSSDSETGGNDA